MSRTLSAIQQTVRQLLNDEFVSGSAQDFQDDELALHIGHCLEEISVKRPYEIDEVRIPTLYSKVLDISDIEDLLEVKWAEYPIGCEPRAKRNIVYLDNETVEIQTSLVPDAGGSGTITGTVTFATGSATVTGSGTSFTDDLKANYLIKKSSGSRWYRIYSVVSDTELTLAEPVRSSDNGADTVNLTEYCYNAVYLHCWKIRQLTEETSTLSPQLEHVLIDGTVAYAALAWINNVRAQVKEAIATVAYIRVAVGKMEGEEGEGGIAQAIADLNDGRALTFNKVYVGGRPLDDYANYARAEQGISNAYRGQVEGYIRELNSRLSISNLLSNYQVWANNKMSQYRADLRGITKQRIFQLYPTS